MLLGDPPRTQGDLNFVFFGIPVRVHPLFWLVAVFLGIGHEAKAGEHVVIPLLIWVVAVFLSILVHEMGHAVAMRAYGYRPRITLYGLGGLTSYNQAQSYGSQGDRPLGRITISAAGPGAGFLFAALITAGLFASGHLARLELGGAIGVTFIYHEFPTPRLHEFIGNLLFINIAWGLINLLPVYPLDGGQIARELFTLKRPREGIRWSLQLSIVVAAGFAVWAIAKWGRDGIFVAVLFGYLAFTSYMALQAYEGRNRPW